ncbi:NUDIX domain-containing protein [Paenibacillus polysaccharolyticus]|uniref:NUDIX hydrolase n=1 Tax=Paenibacillus polysaccharolyticus TaxID=582692 RepID=UPI0020A20118|nr:NUDIX domain-containing protein [Paenibacillus polysaccharolyticus]MCP1136319.1 NUDIX domain-containing protein [Paenibacillus polysaccharolyticus]
MTPERFDIYDDQQQWIGTAPRNEVHAKGYWHRSFHCWIVRDEGDKRMVLFQRRRDIKDTFPGYYDITAAGHLVAGEQLQDAHRELEEELGVHTSFDALTYLFTATQQLQGEVRGIPFLDREFSAVYGLCLNQPLESYVLQASEVDSLYEAPLDDLLALFRQEKDTVQASGVRAQQRTFVQEGKALSTPSLDNTPISTPPRTGESLSECTQEITMTSTDLSSNHGDYEHSASAARLICEVSTADFVPHGSTYYIDVLKALKRVHGV